MLDGSVLILNLPGAKEMIFQTHLHNIIQIYDIFIYIEREIDIILSACFFCLTFISIMLYVVAHARLRRILGLSIWTHLD